MHYHGVVLHCTPGAVGEEHRMGSCASFRKDGGAQKRTRGAL